MFEYVICNQVDEEIYHKQCKALEKHLPNLKRGEELIDVDESKIQRYDLDGKKITVHNSFYLDQVYIKSEVDLDQYF